MRRNVATRMAVAMATVCSIAGAGRADGGHGEPQLTAEAEVTRVRYCADESDDPIVMARIDLEVEIANPGPRRAIVARRLGGPQSMRAALSREELHKDAFVAEFHESEMYGEDEARLVPRLAVTPSPDPERFVVLSGGQSFKTTIEAVLPVVATPELAQEKILKAGDHYWLNIDIPLWPYRLSSEGDLAGAAKRWEKFGDLQTTFVGVVFPVRLPPVTDVEKCGAPTR